MIELMLVILGAFLFTLITIIVILVSKTDRYVYASILGLVSIVVIMQMILIRFGC